MRIVSHNLFKWNCLKTGERITLSQADAVPVLRIDFKMYNSIYNEIFTSVPRTHLWEVSYTMEHSVYRTPTRTLRLWKPAKGAGTSAGCCRPSWRRAPTVFRSRCLGERGACRPCGNLKREKIPWKISNTRFRRCFCILIAMKKVLMVPHLRPLSSHFLINMPMYES